MKYFKVKKVTRYDGRIIYKVFAVESLFLFLIGDWTEYKRNNDTLEEARKQIKDIAEFTVVSKKVVFRFRIK